jgi:tRNA (guanine-N7-)-methyltransferase
MIASHIKSFVLRQGRITQGQKLSLTNLSPQYLIPYQQSITLDNPQFFRLQQPLVIEIGFGMGQATCIIAKNNPQINFVGIEVYLPGIGSILNTINQLQLTNLKIINYDAIIVLQDMILDNSINAFHIYFPDPWPKRNHHKRRIFQEHFLNLLIAKLTIGGYIHVATDDSHYAQQIKNMIANNHLLVSQSSNNTFYISRPPTKFAQRGLMLGNTIYDIVTYKK